MRCRVSTVVGVSIPGRTPPVGLLLLKLGGLSYPPLQQLLLLLEPLWRKGRGRSKVGWRLESHSKGSHPGKG